MKDLISNEYIRRVKTILKSKLNGGNTILAINSRAVSVIRYGAGIIAWTKDEMKALDSKTRKMITMYGGHHPKSDVDRLYFKRSNGGRGLISVEDCIKIECHNLKEYLENSLETGFREASRLDIVENGKYGIGKNQVLEERETNYQNKTLHGQFRKATKDLISKKAWKWLSKGFLKRETESLIVAAQDQALKTRNLLNVVYKENISPLCRLCGDANETVAHIVSECPKLAQREYKVWRHDNVARVIHWKLCEKWGFDRVDRWYDHKPQGVIENDVCKILWDFPIQTDKKLEHNRPDITVYDKINRKCQLIDPSCPFDTRIDQKEEEKLAHYNELKYEIARMWKLKTVEIIPVVIGALGSITEKFEKYIEKLELDIKIEQLQKPCLLGTAKILRKVLNTG